MKVLTLRAVATALLLGTAAVAVAPVPAAQAAVSAAVGNPLKEALTLTGQKRYREAMERVNAAAAAAKTAEERQTVDKTKEYIAVQSGDTSTPLGAKAKFAADANAGRWKEVIADADALRKFNALDNQSMLVVAQAYYKLNQPKECMNYIRNNRLGSGEVALQTLQRCAFDAGDEVTQRTALEQLVSSTGKAEHWKDLLRMSERSRGLSDHNTLDILRLKGYTGSYNGTEDIITHAQIALQLGMAAEGKAVIEKAIAAKTLPASDRTNRLLKLATDRTNDNAANAAKALAAAQNDGDALVKIGEDLTGQNKAKEAIAIIQQGIAKNPKDKANAQIRLGNAYLAAGQKAEALKAFNAAVAAKGDDKTTMVAKLYALYARR